MNRVAKKSVFGVYNNRIWIKARNIGLRKKKDYTIYVAKTKVLICYAVTFVLSYAKNQRTNGPVNAHLISWPSKAQNIQNMENIW